MEAANTQYVTLSSGNKQPIVGYGTWMMQEKERDMAVLKKALKEDGYRHIDTAALYGNEEWIGEAIEDCIKEGVFTREELFVTTKIWCSGVHDVVGNLKESLARLRLDYVDQYLIHWPVIDKEKPVPHHVAWKGMEEVYKLGLAKSIGVSNWTVALLLDMLTYAEVKPAVNQVELHPYLAQNELVKFCQEKGIEVVAFAPLGAPGRPAFIQCGSRSLLEDPVIVEIAKAKGKSAAQVCLQWNIARGVIVIPKTSNPDRSRENFNCNDFKLTEEEIEKINKLDCWARGYNSKELLNIDKVPTFY